MKKITLLLVLLILTKWNNSLAQSYEGYLQGNIPVWVDLNLDVNNNSVSGNYFYKKNGTNIKLTGKIIGNSWVIEEKSKENSITGIFTLTHSGNILTGFWNKPNSKKRLQVNLYKTDSKYKEFAIIPKSDKLILKESTSLQNEMIDYKNEATKKIPKLEFLYAQKNILSVSYYWEAMGAYLSSGTNYHVFNLNTKKEISLLNEINPNRFNEFKAKIIARIQSSLTEHKKEYADIPNEDWINAFGDEETYKKAFVVKEIPNTIFDTFYIKDGNLVIYKEHYFDFPHVIQNLDLQMSIQFTFNELENYLKINSALLELKNK
jgi:hypothetical protein